jgi:hypothetical protein
VAACNRFLQQEGIAPVNQITSIINEPRARESGVML